MLVSIIVPTYNRAHLIDRAVQSVLAQTYREIELIVIDDGSTDHTHEIIEKLSVESEIPIKYHWNRNQGCASARNRGLLLSQGESFAFLDSDDYWIPTACEFMVRTLLEQGSDFVYSPAIEVLEDGTELLNLPAAAGCPTDFALAHFNNSNARNGALLFRKDVIAKVGLLNENLRHNEDSDFVQRVAITCVAAYCDVPAVKVYHHKSNKSKDRAAILAALRSSSQNTLNIYPDFADRLGDSADARILEIHRLLTKAYLRQGSILDAVGVLHDVNSVNGHSDLAKLIVSVVLPDRIRAAYTRIKNQVISGKV